MKGVIETKPSLPRYTKTWDVNIVITYLDALGPPDGLTMKVLTYKVVMLLALLSGQRCETLYALDINGMQLDSDKCIFTIRTLLKTFRVGHHLTPIKLLAFKHDPAFCIVTHLERYIDRTRTLRGLTKLNY
jgi:hypothetical protein